MSGETAAPQVKRYVIQVNLDGRGARARWNKQLYSQIALAGYSEASVQKGKAIASEIISQNTHSENIGYVQPIKEITDIVNEIRNQSTADNSVEDSINTAFKNILISINQNVLPTEIDDWASDSEGKETQLFSDPEIAGHMVELFQKIVGEYEVTCTPMDLFHGHLILYGYGKEAGFGILFHAKEYQSHIFEDDNQYEARHTRARALMIGNKVDLSLKTGSKASWKWSDEEINLYDFYEYFPLALNRNRRNFLWTASNGAIRVIIDENTGKIPPSLDPRTPAADFEPGQAVEQKLFGYEFGAINYFPETSYEEPFVKGSKVTP